MLRKMMIALFAVASVVALAPDPASARGGGGGGFHGGGGFGGGGGFRGGGGFGGGGFPRGGCGNGRRWLPCSCNRRRRFPFSCDRWRLVSVRWHSHRADFVAALLRSTVFAAVSTPGSGIGRFPIVAVGAGLGYWFSTATAMTILYDAGYGYDDSYYYGDNGCYIVRRSVLTRLAGEFGRCKCAADPGRPVSRQAAK